MQNDESEPQCKRVLLKEGLFHSPASPTDKPFLIGSKCMICGNVFFPGRVICPACVVEDTLEEIHLGATGRLNSFSTVHVAPEGFTAPYTLAFVDLREGPTIFAIIAGGTSAGEKNLETGMELELIIESVRVDENGNEVIGYKYRPIETTQE